MANLVSVDEYKEHEGISSSKEEARLESIVPSVSQLVKTYCANSFVDYFSVNKVEILNIEYPTQNIYPTEVPVNTIVSIEERRDASASYTTLDAADYFLDENTDAIVRIKSGKATNWEEGPGAVKLTYTAGYASVPADLRLAVYDLITYYLRDEHKERKTLAGASIQNEAVQSRYAVQFPPHIKRVLDLYKNPV
jgi:hypothetical protein